MPLLVCSKCHHEYEVSKKELNKKCDWCGGRPGKVLEKETSLERYLKHLYGGER